LRNVGQCVATVVGYRVGGFESTLLADA